MTTAVAQQGKLDDYIKIMRDSFIPMVKKQKGFKGAFFFSNRDTGKGISVTLWNTEADATETAKNEALK